MTPTRELLMTERKMTVGEAELAIDVLEASRAKVEVEIGKMIDKLVSQGGELIRGRSQGLQAASTILKDEIMHKKNYVEAEKSGAV